MAWAGLGLVLAATLTLAAGGVYARQTGRCARQTGLCARQTGLCARGPGHGETDSISTKRN